METIIQAPVTLTEGALTEVRRLMTESGFDPSQKLRVGVKGGGCSGMTYVLGFDAPEADDAHYEIEGVPVLLKPAHEMYLHGITVHFENGLNARGFVFQNPNASATCGCGSSFAV